MMHSIDHQAVYCLAYPLHKVNGRHDASLFGVPASILCVASSTAHHATPSTKDTTDDAIDDNPHAPYDSYEDWLESIDATFDDEIDFYPNHNTQVHYE